MKGHAPGIRMTINYVNNVKILQTSLCCILVRERLPMRCILEVVTWPTKVSFVQSVHFRQRMLSPDVLYQTLWKCHGPLCKHAQNLYEHRMQLSASHIWTVINAWKLTISQKLISDDSQQILALHRTSRTSILNNIGVSERPGP